MDQYGIDSLENLIQEVKTQKMILLLAKITDSLFNHSVSKMRPKRAFYG